MVYYINCPNSTLRCHYRTWRYHSTGTFKNRKSTFSTTFSHLQTFETSETISRELLFFTSRIPWKKSTSPTFRKDPVCKMLNRKLARIYRTKEIFLMLEQSCSVMSQLATGRRGMRKKGTWNSSGWVFGRYRHRHRGGVLYLEIWLVPKHFHPC